MRFAVFFLLLVSAPSFALDLFTSWKKSDQGAWVKMVHLVCESDEREVCNSLCADSLTCVTPEPWCLNCAGSTWPFMRILFTEAIRNFYPSGKYVSDFDLVGKFLNNFYIFIEAQSVYNYFSKADAEKLAATMRSWCPPESDSQLLAVRLNAERIPEDLEFTVCRYTGRPAVFLEMVRGVKPRNFGPLKNFEINSVFKGT
ncbi:MAG: hypothetical protein N2578_09090 [Bdellovibrionaceae bacterium]|nr:hypothetical protein [Pseudobdellovibrionaceae bacterium]